MNDYYSNFPGPTYTQAIRELSRDNLWLKKYITQCIDEEITKYGGLGSYTGWNVAVKPSIMKKVALLKKWFDMFHYLKSKIS